MSNSAKPVYTDSQWDKIQGLYDEMFGPGTTGTPPPAHHDRYKEILRVIVEAADSGSAERLAVSINAARSLLRK